MKLPRPAIFVSAVAAVILVIWGIGALLLPRLVDSQAVKDRLSVDLAKRFEGRLTIGKITLLWFPRPLLILERAELSFDDNTQGSIRTVKIYPAIFYLLTGRLIVRHALLEEPKLRMRLADRSEKPFDLEALEKQFGSALIRFTRTLPAPRIDISEGSAEIRIGDKPPVVLENITAQTIGSPGELRFDLEARSSFVERLRIGGKIFPENFKSQLEIAVRRLKIKDSVSYLARQISEYAQSGEASLELKIAAVGLRQVKASIDASMSPMVFARHGGTATIEAKRVKAAITYEAGALQVDLQQLDLASPRVKASGELKSVAGSLSARIKVRDGDIAQMGELARRMADDAEGVKKILHYIPAGTISEMSIESAGSSFADLVSSRKVVVSGLLRDCGVLIPGPDLELKKVAGSLRISGGLLEADGISANLGAIEGSDGKLKLGLEGKTAPFHLDLLVRGGAPELQSVLLKLVHDEGFRAELLKVQNIEGELSGRLILGERLDALAPMVTVSKAKISATYAPIPFPIAIEDGRFNYDQRIIKLENARGSVGRSTFRGLGGIFDRDGSRQIKVGSQRVSLDLQQTDTLLRRFENLRSQFAKLQSARGHIELENLTLAGAYDNPAGWIFATTGKVDQVEVTHADFPGRISLSRGQFAASHGRIEFSDTAAMISDATLTGGGTFDYATGRALQLEANGEATIGAQMTQWLSRRVELPEEVKLRAPLKIAARRLAWRADGDFSFRGDMTVADGPTLTLDAVKHPQGLVLQDLTIDDGGRRAQMRFQLAKDNLDLSFSGELAQSTIDKIFASFPMKGGALRGDIQISAALATPVRILARGKLEGTNLRIPMAVENALLEKFSIEAEEDNLLIRSADLRWRNSRVAVAGKIASGKEALRMDLDVSGDRLDWNEVEMLFGPGAVQQSHASPSVLSLPPLEGTVRLKADNVAIDRFNLITLQLNAAVSRSSIRAEIDHGVVCGINVQGSFDAVGQDIGLDLLLSAADGQLGPTTICLTNQQSDIKGTYSLTARLTGRGDREHLGSALQGSFDFSARDGEFVQAAAIDATFDYLNGTGDFAVNFPDLNRQVFPYRMLSAKGRLEGETVFNDEIVIAASPLTVTVGGKVDLQRKLIDLKGLVSVALPANQVIKRIPVVGAIVGGSLVGIPLRVSGPLERPAVNYLSPADVGTELLSLPIRILGMPLEAIRLFVPSGENRDKNITR